MVGNVARGGDVWQEAYIFSENTKQVKEMKMVWGF